MPKLQRRRGDEITPLAVRVSYTSGLRCVVGYLKLLVVARRPKPHLTPKFNIDAVVAVQRFWRL